MENEEYLLEALAAFDLKSAQATFIRHNENITYKVDQGRDAYLLRIHKPVDGFSFDIFDYQKTAKTDLVRGETDLLAHLNQCGFTAQAPQKSRDGGCVTILPDGTAATLLSWIEGETLDKSQVTPETGCALGVMAARLHAALKKLGPGGARRYLYDASLLERIRTELTAARDARHICEEHEATLQRAVHVMEERMAKLDQMKGMHGYAHADLGMSNLIRTKDGIVPIDFSLSGYGYYVMDIGMILSNFSDRSVHERIVEGYLNEGGVLPSTEYIEPFYALAVLLFIACQHGKHFGAEWFPKRMDCWNRDIFAPLAAAKQFLFI